MAKLKVLVSVLLLVFLLLACAPKAAPAPAPAAPVVPAAPATSAKAPLSAAAKPPSRPAWEEKWDTTLAAAKKEGKVIIYTTAGGAVRPALMKIAEMHGLEAEVLSGRAEQLLAKISLERKAGLYQVDLWINGANPIVTLIKPAGNVERLDPMLILPDVTDQDTIKKVWYGGTLPWVDKDHTAFLIALSPGPAIVINTNLVKPDEIKSWRDLLNPKWEGKLALNDPTVSGTGQMAFQAVHGLMGEDYIRELVKTKPLLLRDSRQQLDWLALGKVPIAVWVQVEILAEFMRAGAPVKAVTPADGTYASAGNAGAIGFYKNAPHPNAATAYINWLITKEAQEILAPAASYHSTREDVPADYLLPGLSRVRGVKYFPGSTEESFMNRPVTDKLAKEIFGPLVK